VDNDHHILKGFTMSNNENNINVNADDVTDDTNVDDRLHETTELSNKDKFKVFAKNALVLSGVVAAVTATSTVAVALTSKAMDSILNKDELDVDDKRHEIAFEQSDIEGGDLDSGIDSDVKELTQE